MLKEFKDFIQKGDVVTIAVGLVMALYFQKIVDAVLVGVINPLIAAAAGEAEFAAIGFDVGDAFISVGLVLDALISFVAVAFFLFLVVKAVNKMKPPEEEDDGPSETDLLTEIRDSLKAQA